MTDLVLDTGIRAFRILTNSSLHMQMFDHDSPTTPTNILEI